MLSIFNRCPSLFTLSVHAGAMYCVYLQCSNLCVHLLFGWSSLQEETVLLAICVVTLLFFFSFFMYSACRMICLSCGVETKWFPIFFGGFWLSVLYQSSVGCHCALQCLEKISQIYKSSYSDCCKLGAWLFDILHLLGLFASQLQWQFLWLCVSVDTQLWDNLKCFLRVNKNAFILSAVIFLCPLRVFIFHQYFITFVFLLEINVSEPLNEFWSGLWFMKIKIHRRLKSNAIWLDMARQLNIIQKHFSKSLSLDL